MQLKLWTDTPECKRHGMCHVCREKGARGLHWRKAISKNWRLPNNDLNFECPYGIPWGIKQKDARLSAAPLMGAWWTAEPVQSMYRDALADAAKDAYLSNPYGYGRGIVIPGGGTFFASAYVTIRAIRQVGCTLPIEVWHYIGEMGPIQRAILEHFDVRCIEVDPTSLRRNGGWELKAYSILHSRFEEILFLDADNYPCKDPTFLFDSKEYLDTGYLLWSDRPSKEDGDASPGAKIPQSTFIALGVPYKDEWSKEGGQLVVNKKRKHSVIKLAHWMNQHSEYYYQWLYGDKDTFWLAALMLGESYSAHYEQWIGNSPAIVAKDWDGWPLFVHRCNGKFALPGDTFEKTLQVKPEARRNDTLPLEADVWRFYDEMLAELDRLCPKLHAVAVCVGYGDYLRATVKANSQHFDSFTIVTTLEDKETIAVCAENGLDVLLTDKVNVFGSAFNLGAMRNQAYDHVRSFAAPNDWIVSIDVDCLLPAETRLRIATSELNPKRIYGTQRIHPDGSLVGGDNNVSGFFQMFSCEIQGRYYDEQYKDAGWTDVWFRDLWAQEDRATIKGIVSQHLAEPAQDWQGRVSSPYVAPVAASAVASVAVPTPTPVKGKCGKCSRSKDGRPHTDIRTSADRHESSPLSVAP